jgi:heme exporter protein D
MTHLPYIVASYGLTVVVSVFYSVSAFIRMRRAGARLEALDPRARRR